MSRLEAAAQRKLDGGLAHEPRANGTQGAASGLDRAVELDRAEIAHLAAEYQGETLEVRDAEFGGEFDLALMAEIVEDEFDGKRHQIAVGDARIERVETDGAIGVGDGDVTLEMAELVLVPLGGKVEKIGGIEVDVAFERHPLQRENVGDGAFRPDARVLRIARQHADVVDAELALLVLVDALGGDRPDLAQIRVDGIGVNVQVADDEPIQRPGDAPGKAGDAEIVEGLRVAGLRRLRQRAAER